MFLNDLSSGTIFPWLPSFLFPWQLQLAQMCCCHGNCLVLLSNDAMKQEWYLHLQFCMEQIFFTTHGEDIRQLYKISSKSNLNPLREGFRQLVMWENCKEIELFHSWAWEGDWTGIFKDCSGQSSMHGNAHMGRAQGLPGAANSHKSYHILFSVRF